MAGKDSAGGKKKVEPELGDADTAEINQSELVEMVDAAVARGKKKAEPELGDADTAEISRAEALCFHKGCQPRFLSFCIAPMLKSLHPSSVVFLPGLVLPTGRILLRPTSLVLR